MNKIAQTIVIREDVSELWMVGETLQTGWQLKWLYVPLGYPTFLDQKGSDGGVAGSITRTHNQTEVLFPASTPSVRHAGSRHRATGERLDR
jgi:hypothetical protein